MNPYRELVYVAVIGSLLAGCSRSPVDPGQTLLASRDAGPDTSRVTDALRHDGGNVFVKLTGRAGTPELLSLQAAGLSGPAGYGGSTAVTFDNILPNAVWGYVAAGGVRRIAELSYVIMIEPSADSGYIYLP